MSEHIPRFEALIETHHDEIYRYLWRLLDGASHGDSAVEAHDLTQEVFVRAYHAYGRLRPGSNARAWLYKIATNCAYTQFGRANYRAGQDVPLDDHHEGTADDLAASPEWEFIRQQEISSVREEIAGLPPKQRSALIMRYVQELDYAEIAEALGCSEESARANVYQALKRLRAALREPIHE